MRRNRMIFGVMGLGLAATGLGFLPLDGMLAIHKGVIQDVTKNPAMTAIVKLYARFSIMDVGDCTGTFITDRHVLTSAHCLEFDERVDKCGATEGCSKVARTVEAWIARPGGKFYTLGESRTFWMAKDPSDVAVIQFPPGTFKGTPIPMRLYEESLIRRLEKRDAPLRTCGYGLTEDGKDSDFLRCIDVKDVDYSSTVLVTNDLFRLDHGDSGGPLLARFDRLTETIVSVNYARHPNEPLIQYYRPLLAEDFEDALERNQPIPTVSCNCEERVTFVQRAGSKVVGRWSENNKKSFKRPLGLEDPCARGRTQAKVEDSAGLKAADGTDTVITRTAPGATCTLSSK